MDTVLHNIYISDLRAASNDHLLRTYGITHIVNASSEENVFPGRYTYLRILVNDSVDASIDCFFEAVCDFIDRYSAHDTRFLIHCNAGISRSSTLVLAYMIHRCHIRLPEALGILRRKHAIARPNPGFINQLHRWVGVVAGRICSQSFFVNRTCR